MNKKYRNYFDDVKNIRIQDKFIEHFIRLVFFTVVLAIEAVYKKIKEILFHLKNRFKGRTLSDVLKKYNHYKDSVNSLIHNRNSFHNLQEKIHDTVNRFFSDEEKKLVFGLKDTTHSLMEKSKQIFTSVSGYTVSVKNRYFRYRPFPAINKDLTASMLTLFILNKYKNRKNIISAFINTEAKKEFIELHSSGYRTFINDTFKKFYTHEFKKKISAAKMDMNSLRPHIEKILNTIDKLEKKQIRYTFGQS